MSADADFDDRVVLVRVEQDFRRRWAERTGHDRVELHFFCHTCDRHTRKTYRPVSHPAVPRDEFRAALLKDMPQQTCATCGPTTPLYLL